MKNIFIISQPRAGSTFLQRILSNSEDVCTVGEPWFLLPALKNDLELKVKTGVSYNSNWANAAISEFVKNSTDYSTTLRKHNIALYNQLTKDFTKENGGKVFLDKTPRYYYIIEELIAAFPEAKFIVLLRNPLDVFSSILETWVKKDYPLLNNFKDDLFLSLEIFNKHRDNQKLYFVKYEDILTEPEKEINRLCKYCEIDFDPKMLDISLSRNWKFGDPKMNVLKKVERNNSNKWAGKDLSDQKWRFLNEYVEFLDTSMLDNLGYNKYDFKKILTDNIPNRSNLFFTGALSFFLGNTSRKYLKPLFNKKRQLYKKFKKVF